MKNKDEAIRFLMSVAKSENGHDFGFVIAYPDKHGELRYVNEYGEPLSKVPAGMTVIQARNREQAEVWVSLYPSMGDGFIIGNLDGENQYCHRPKIKITDNFAIAI